MIRFVHLVSRKSDVSLEDFRHFWNGQEFNHVLGQLADLLLTAQVKKSLTLEIELNNILQEDRGARCAFDGIIEIIWQSGKEVTAIQDDEEFIEIYAKLTQLQSQFIDFTESRRFFTEYSD